MTLNLILIVDSESTHNSVKIRTKIVDFRLFCVELWTKHVFFIEFRSQCRILRVWTIVYYIWCIIKSDSSESKKANFWKVHKILFWYRIQNLRKILWRFAQKSLIFVHSASSYGQNKFRIEFRSQCHIFGWYIDISLGESGAHEAPYVCLLIRASRPRPGESPGASSIAAPLEAE